METGRPVHSVLNSDCSCQHFNLCCAAVLQISVQRLQKFCSFKVRKTPLASHSYSVSVLHQRRFFRTGYGKCELSVFGAPHLRVHNLIFVCSLFCNGAISHYSCERPGFTVQTVRYWRGDQRGDR